MFASTPLFQLCRRIGWEWILLLLMLTLTMTAVWGITRGGPYCPSFAPLDGWISTIAS